ncbi:MAG: DUF58 domain-containing protein [Alphaproteobacteria bacterium]
MLYPEKKELIELSRFSTGLDLNTRAKSSSIVAGGARSPFRGRGLEFEEVREYVQGDDVRNIDWRVTARTGKAHLKLFSEERERSVLLCVDCNHAMRFGTRTTFKSVQAARIAVMLGWANHRAHNAIGASLFGDVKNGMSYIKPLRARSSVLNIINRLCDVETYNDEQVLLSEHLRHVRKAAPSGSLVFVISDFLQADENLKRSLSNLRRHSDVVLIAVNDMAECALPKMRALQFGNNTGLPLIVNGADKAKSKAYEQYWNKNRDDLLQISMALNIALIQTFTHEDVIKTLPIKIRKVGYKGRRAYE